MLRTNLSTRPFYNERLVLGVLALAALVLAGLTGYNLWRVFDLSGRASALQQRIGAADARAEAARGEATRTRATIDRAALNATIAATEEANRVIDRRAMSWTALLAKLERTLPATVRLASIRPAVLDDGGIEITLGVVARDVEGIDAFIEALEQDGAFSEFLATQESTSEEGDVTATLTGRYRPPVGGGGAS